MRCISLVVAVAAGCGNDGGGGGDAGVDGAVIDAAGDAAMIDAGPQTVFEVMCPEMIEAQVVTIDNPNQFSPETLEIGVGGVVRFVTSSRHDVAPRPGMPSDVGLVVDFEEAKCLQFTQAGSFHYRCRPHDMMFGVVHVTP